MTFQYWGILSLAFREIAWTFPGRFLPTCAPSPPNRQALLIWSRVLCFVYLCSFFAGLSEFGGGGFPLDQKSQPTRSSSKGGMSPDLWKLPENMSKEPQPSRTFWERKAFTNTLLSLFSQGFLAGEWLEQKACLSGGRFSVPAARIRERFVESLLNCDVCEREAQD